MNLPLNDTSYSNFLFYLLGSVNGVDARYSCKNNIGQRADQINNVLKLSLRGFIRNRGNLNLIINQEVTIIMKKICRKTRRKYMKNKVRTKALSCLLCLAIMLSLMSGMTVSVQAATTWNTNHTFNGGMTYNDEIIVTKDVTLTINGCDVTANAGIYIQSGTLTVKGTGKLYVYGKRDTGYTYGHGIKGNVIVNGARLDVRADDKGDGIQGNLDIIGDASVDVYGGYGGTPQSSGVGSGGGRGISGNVTLNGGTLYVEGGSGGDGAYGDGSKKGGSGGAGIGGNVTIKGGGYVHAIGGSGGEGTGDYGGGGYGHYGVVGSLTATSGSAMVIGGDGGSGYGSRNPNAACYGAITGAFRKESTTGHSWTDISGDTSSLQYVKVDGHAHHYISYTASGATITATCDAEDCLLPNRTASITINAPTGLLMEDGSTKAATISGEIPQVATPGITYTKDGAAISASQVKEAGDYVASITLGDAVASVEFTIIPPTYTITIPAKLNAKGSGYNATDGISAGGVILEDKKVVVTASSANGWKLKNGKTTIPYYLTAAEGGAQKTKWVFYKDELDQTVTKSLGAVVSEYDRIPSGEYADTVTFTAKLESIYTTRDVWNSNDLYDAVAGGAKTFTKDGFTLTCGNAYCSDGMFFISNGGSFTYDRGVITKIEFFGQTKGDISPSICGSLGWKLDGYGYGSSDNTAVQVSWTGEPAKTIRFNNGFRFAPSNYRITITTIEDDR